MRKLLVSVALISVCSLSGSCIQARKQGDASSPASLSEQWAKRAWIEKVSRTLRKGNGVLTDDQVELMLPISDGDIIESFMGAAAFDATVVDFLLYYLDAKQTDNAFSTLTAIPKNPSDLNTLVDIAERNLPQVLPAARAIVSGGDLYTLFAPRQPLLIRIPSEIPSPASLSMRDKLLLFIDKLLLFLPVDGADFDRQAACNVFIGKNPDGTLPSDAGHPQSLVNEISSTFPAASRISVAINRSLDPISRLCNTLDPEPSQAAVAQIALDVRAIRDLVSRLFELPQTYLTTNPTLTKISQLIAAGPGEGIPWTGTPTLSGNFWRRNPNSSTNYNRKRAAYILRNYFCDDLTPISIVANSNHTEGQHASDPGCQACHYKLDPMAGFFREYGIAGIKATSAFLVFDDLKTITGQEYSAYLSHWESANIGFIRSSTKTELNAYGESPEDLFAIIRNAPEVRQCLVRRMAEYFIGKSQVFDGGWLNSLEKVLQPPGQSDNSHSGNNFKDVVKRLLTSQTFRTQDPEPDRCYDFEPGASEPNLPCAIAWTIRKNCASCHNGAGAQGGIDLSQWITAASGEQTFSHIDAAGVQIAPLETLKRIRNRLEATDPAVRMPLNREMPATDRARLYKWISEKLD